MLVSLNNSQEQKFNIFDQFDRRDGNVNIDRIDPRILMYENSISLRNLSHSVMKLMAVQQESVTVPRNAPS